MESPLIATENLQFNRGHTFTIKRSNVFDCICCSRLIVRYLLYLLSSAGLIQIEDGAVFLFIE